MLSIWKCLKFCRLLFKEFISAVTELCDSTVTIWLTNKIYDLNTKFLNTSGQKFRLVHDEKKDFKKEV